MTAFHLRFLFISYLLATLISVSSGLIRCYVCTTQTGQFASRCGDKFTLTSVDTSRCQGVCFKTRGKRQQGGREVVEVTRGCELKPDKLDGCESSHHNGISVNKCYCNEELCNSATKPVVSPLKILISLSAAFLYKYIL